MNERMELLFWDYPKGLGFEWVTELRPASKEVSFRCVGYPEGDCRARVTFSGDTHVEFIKFFMISVGFTKPEAYR
jgi:hypothetical protein